jgi:hypothetical protein
VSAWASSRVWHEEARARATMVDKLRAALGDLRMRPR